MSFNIEEGRYVILGSIDGLLATLGIILGVSVVGASNLIVVSAGFGGAIALALTNGLGSYLAESTIEYGKLVKTEKSLLRKLSNTYVES
jgi:predicted membrane protein (TIGR00267 family)